MPTTQAGRDASLSRPFPLIPTRTIREGLHEEPHDNEQIPRRMANRGILPPDGVGWGPLLRLALGASNVRMPDAPCQLPASPCAGPAYEFPIHVCNRVPILHISSWRHLLTGLASWLPCFSPALCDL